MKLSLFFKLSFLVGASVCLAFGEAQAQVDTAALANETLKGLSKDPPPPGPLMKRAPSFAEWSVQFTYVAPAAKVGAEANRPNQILVTRTAPLVHIQIFAAPGKEEAWINDKIRVIRFSGNGGKLASEDVGKLDPDTKQEFNSFPYDLRQVDFPEIQCITPQNYVGLNVLKNYMVFATQSRHQVVIVDMSTRLPLRLIRTDAVVDYNVKELPPVIRPFPSDVQQFLQFQLEQARRMGSYGERP